VELREKTINSKEIYKGRVISLSVDTVITPGGNQATREIVHHPGGVAVVAIDNDDMIYLVEQYRVPYDDILLEIPAGKLDSKDEDPKDAALRELSEETGLTCKEIKHIGDFYPSVGFLDENLRLFMATGLSQGQTHPDDDEYLNIVKMPFEKAVQMVMDGKIKDGKTIAGILKVNLLK
jgi:ADP-ribose pyrophosphatase